MTPSGRVLVCLATGFIAARAARASDTEYRPTAADAWQTLSVGLYSDAYDQFAQAGRTREALLGHAIAHLQRPPVTPASVDAAEQELTALAAGNDTAAHAARYFLGRLRQLHPMKPDLRAAELEYERLVATGADDTWCRLALVKLAILKLTALRPPGPVPAQLAAVEPLLARTADPATQHDLHLVISEVRLNHELYDAGTLGHLRAALATTAASDPTRADLLIQVARVATLVGDLALAREHYERFLHDYPRERRAFDVTQAMAHLGGAFPP